LPVWPRITHFSGIFAIMALSNAIVPVLPAYSDQTSWTGAIYAAYFLGAFLSTLPAGILSDRFGRIALMRTGLAMTVLSGAVLIHPGSAAIACTARLIEGIGAGLFVVPAMAAVNSEADHEKLSGYFLALLNAGLVLGLVAAGFLAAMLDMPGAGVFLFTALAIIPMATSLVTKETRAPPAGHDRAALKALFVRYRWVLYSSVVLIGITGVATSLYPEFSGATADRAGLWIAAMSIATIVTVLVVSRFPFNDIRGIQVSSVLMAAGVILSFFTPAGFLVLGALAGVVMIAQMEILSAVREHQGIAMGLFSTSSYLGMALLPLLAGFIAEGAGFFIAFMVTALSALTVTFTVSRE